MVDASRFEDLTLELDSDAVRDLVNAVTDRVVEHLEGLSDAPASNLDGAEQLAKQLIENSPGEGDSLESVLDHLFDTVFPKSITTPGPGFMGYIPGGGIVHAASWTKEWPQRASTFPRRH